MILDTSTSLVLVISLFTIILLVANIHVAIYTCIFAQLVLFDHKETPLHCNFDWSLISTIIRAYCTVYRAHPH